MVEQEKTFIRLDEHRKKAKKVPFNFKLDKYVIFSDTHKGNGGKTDFFKKNEAIYCIALDYYLKSNFTLILAGDIEEGWKFDMEEVVDCYGETAFKMEKKFVDADGDRYYRIYGNHDHDWKREDIRNKFLKPVLGDIEVHPAVILGEKTIIVHGHEGDPTADQLRGFYRWFVNRFGRSWQEFFGIKRSAATNYKIREKRDRYLYAWAKEKELLLIAGHTHKAMFESFSEKSQLNQKMKVLEKQLKGTPTSDVIKRLLLEKSIEQIKELLRKLKKHKLGEDSEKPVPCYFNDGAGLYRSGITGIELENGRIRLVKWEFSDTTCSNEGVGKIRSGDFLNPERLVYQSGDLEKILNRIKK